MRGALSYNPMTEDDPRIIPADAGSTMMRLRSRKNGPDHPRGCGEHHGQNAFEQVRQGSSPRMRGALFGSLRYLWASRIIPADAGSTTYHY